jgi:NADH-quinone oxidoreductase subunit E
VQLQYHPSHLHQETTKVKPKHVLMTVLLGALAWVAPVGAAGWNPSGESQRLEAAEATIAEFKATDSGLAEYFKKAYAWAVFPTIGKGGFIFSGAYGDGVVYERGKPIGRTSVTQASFGLTIGGQTSSELLFFRDRAALDNFRSGNYEFSAQASAVIALLWRAQEQNAGWLSKPAMEYVGQMLDMAFIRVYEVATFYTMFQLSPVGRKAHIQVCGTTPCMLRGAEDLKKVCQRKIHHDPHHLSTDGNFSWEEAECLGACVNAPMVQIWKDTYEDLTPESFEKLIDDLAAGKSVKPGPQNGRQLSAPEGALTSLTDKSLYSGNRTFKRIEAPPPPPAPPAAAAAPVAAPVAVAAAAPAEKVAAKKPVAKTAAKKSAPAKAPAKKKR